MNIAGQRSIAASNTTECGFQLKAPGACELVVDEGISCFRIIVCIQDGFLSMKKTRTKRSSVLDSNVWLLDCVLGSESTPSPW
jgi:hypothetical protein